MKLQEIYNKAKTENRNDITRFMRDMKRAGYKSSLRYYEGRFWYKGVGVVVDSVDNALQNTKVKCQWDNMGLSVIVYPIQGF